MNHLNDVDARQHLLTECTETLTLRGEYLKELLSIDQTKAAEYLSMDTWDSYGFSQRVVTLLLLREGSTQEGAVLDHPFFSPESATRLTRREIL